MNRRVMFIMSLAVLSTALIILSCTGHKFVTKKLYVSERLIIPTGPETSVLKLDGDTDKLSWDSDEILVWDAPVGDRVLAALPLPRGERFEDYGLCKFDLKIEGGPVDIMVFVEKPGEKRRLYRPVDINEPPPGWRTIHIDLKQPEIVRESHFPADEPRIAFNLWAMNTGYPDQEPTRMIAIRNVRLCKRRLDVRWDGVNYRVVPDKSGDLVYEYPVTVYNKDNENLRIAPRIETSVRHYGTASFTPGETALAPGDSTVFTAVLRLPSEYVKEFPVLYCEWFMPLFSIVGMPDSDEGILRSSDLISLPLIIMPELESPVAVFDREGLRLMRERYHTIEIFFLFI